MTDDCNNRYGTVKEFMIERVGRDAVRSYIESVLEGDRNCPEAEKHCFCGEEIKIGDDTVSWDIDGRTGDL